MMSAFPGVVSVSITPGRTLSVCMCVAVNSCRFFNVVVHRLLHDTGMSY